MSETAQKESMQFQTEVNQILKLMIHSLYSNKEIFLRELISNASDACDKLRFDGLSNDALFEGNSDLSIKLEFDKEANTVTVSDNGIGMSKEEVIENIGTIAKSGTKQFLDSLTGDQSKDAHLIGQFGVGFYSGFIVADKITLITRRAGDDKANGVRWESDGESGYSIESVEKEGRGTSVILHLKDDEKEFADEWRVKTIVKKYSDHITFPVTMMVEKPGEGEDDATTIEEETLNSASALWTRAKTDIKAEEYKEFYKHISHDFEDPEEWIHSRVEGKYEYTTLFYLPQKAPFDLWDRDHVHGIKLFVKRVFIMDDTEKLMPKYLRFVRGLVDSNDLPLNVSREILQSNKIIESIKSGSVKKVLGMLEGIAKKDADRYQTVWDQFGPVLKEGPAEDFSNKEKILGLMRFASTHSDDEKQNVSLDDYIARMKAEQDKIYYITAENFATAKNSPHLELLRKKGLEVLLMSDRVDEWMMSFIQDYKDKKFVSVAKGNLDLGELETEEDKKQQEEVEKKAEKIVERMKKVLEGKVSDVKVSTRLTSSPACLVMNEQDMALHMQQILKQAGQEIPSNKPMLEINPEHPVMQKVEDESDDAKFADWVSLIYDQSVLAEGGQLEDPATFVRHMNEMLLEMGK